MWQDALRETVAEFRGQAPQWGQVDCCQLARAYHRRVTGRDVCPAEYATEREALRLLARHGGLEGLLFDLLGDSHDHQAGDVVLVHLAPTVRSAGISAGYAVFTIHPTDGLVRVSADHILEAWPCRRA